MIVVKIRGFKCARLKRVHFNTLLTLRRKLVQLAVETITKPQS